MVKLYVEGGAHDSAFDNQICRQAFREFFVAAGLEGKLPRTIACGGRKAAYDLFVTATNNSKPGELPILLVDSETAVQSESVWGHLKQRPGDNWEKPDGASDRQAFLMVQVMETWFIADREALKSFFGINYRENAIPKWQHLEDVPKQSVYDALNQATAACGAKKYSKGKLSFALLAKISPAKVEAASPHAKALLEFLRQV